MRVARDGTSARGTCIDLKIDKGPGQGLCLQQPHWGAAHQLTTELGSPLWQCLGETGTWKLLLPLPLANAQPAAGLDFGSQWWAHTTDSPLGQQPKKREKSRAPKT